MAPPAQEAPRKFALYLMGSQVGEYSHAVASDGQLKSELVGTSGPLKGKSSVTVRRAAGKVSELTLDQDIGGRKITAKLAGGKLVGDVAGTKVDTPLEIKDPLFGNLHPGLNRFPIDALGSRADAKFRVFIADGLGAPELTVKRIGVRPVAVNGVARVANQFKFSFPNVDLDVFVDEKGEVVAEDVPTQTIRFVAAGWDKLFVDPLAQYPELSQPSQSVVSVDREEMALRDGVRLVHSRAAPSGAGKFPTILVRTPYGRGNEMIKGAFYAKRGYVFIAQDCRGREDSEGDWDPFFREGKDGYDTIEWIAKQPWSDGKVGMIGGSYSGAVQWMAAVEKPAALKCIVPQVSPPGPYFNLPYEYGTMMLYGTTWWSKVVRDKKTNLSGPMGYVSGPEKFLTLPLTKVDDQVLGANVPFFDRWLKRTKPSDFGDWNFDGKLKGVKVPALHISGWWDGDGIGTRLNWAATRANGVDDQWLIYGPWTHSFNTTSKLGDEDYGAGAILELDSLYLRWFDTWLKGKDVGLEKLPRVRAFLKGSNRWLDLDDWPPTASATRTLYLSGDGPSNGATSMGTLVDKPLDMAPDRYTYNPAAVAIPDELKDPDPAKATTKISLKNEPGVLVYRGEPMAEAQSILGPIDANLYYATTAKDADLFATLGDEAPDGTLRIVAQVGKIRASFVNGGGKPVTPGRTYRATLRIWDSAHEFAKGHRLVLLVTSDQFPMFARNLGTGEPIADATKMVSASQTIFRDTKRPSSLKFRVLRLPPSPELGGPSQAISNESETTKGER